MSDYLDVTLDYKSKTFNPKTLVIGVEGDHLSRFIRFNVPFELAWATVTLHIQKPDGTKGAEVVNLRGGIIEHAIDRRLSELGSYKLSLEFVKDGTKYNTRNMTLRVAEHLSAGEDELPGKDPSLADHIISELDSHNTRLVALESGESGEVTHDYVDSADAATLAAAKAYAETMPGVEGPAGPPGPNTIATATDFWKGTQAQWDALTQAQKISYTLALIVDNAAPSDTTPPTLTGALTATAGDKQVDLAWNAATDNVGVMGYDIEYGTTISYGTAVTSATNSKTITGLTNGTTYYFRVRAYDSAGNKSAWLTATAQPLAPADTTAPTLTGSITATPSTNTLALAWNAATDNVAVTGYDIEHGLTTSYGTAATSVTNSTTLSGLTASTLYYFRVRAYDAAGNKSEWITGSATTEASSATETTLYLLNEQLAGSVKKLSTAVGSSATNQLGYGAEATVIVEILDSSYTKKSELGRTSYSYVSSEDTLVSKAISLANATFTITDYLAIKTSIAESGVTTFAYPLAGITTIGSSLQINLWGQWEADLEEGLLTYGNATFDSNVKLVLS